MNSLSLTDLGVTMQADLERLSPSARQAALRPALAHLLYLGEHGPDAPPFDTLDAHTQNHWLRKARGCQRSVSRLPWAVAIEQAAAAMCEAQEWGRWPDLEAFAIRCDPTTPPAEQARHLSVARIEARQKLRYLARQAAEAIAKHLRDGNGRDEPQLEQRVVDDTQKLAAADAETRRVLKPTPTARSFGVVEGGRSWK